jgi:hypothetical protein
MRHRWYHGIEKHVCTRCGVVVYRFNNIKRGIGPCNPVKKEVIQIAKSQGQSETDEVAQVSGV